LSGVRSWLDDSAVFTWPGALLVALVAALLVAFVFFASTSGAAFAPFNPAWDGTSDFREGIETNSSVTLTTATDTARYGTVEANDTVAFVLAPGRPYGPDDVERVRGFLDRGGTLVVMENFGTPGTALLQDVGASATVDGRLIRDEQNHDRAPTMPVATNVTDHPLTSGVDQLTLNYASAVEPGGATVLVRTSEFAYLTEDESVDLDDDTELTAAPVATVESVGAGTVVVVSDPSIVINVMLERPDNEAFLQGLYGGDGQVLVDRSHAAGLPPLTRLVLLFRGSALLQVLVGGLGIAAVAVAADRRLALRSRLPVRTERRRAEEPASTMTDAERAAYLRSRHPDWADERVDRLIAAFNRRDPERDGESES